MGMYNNRFERSEEKWGRIRGRSTKKEDKMLKEIMFKEEPLEDWAFEG